MERTGSACYKCSVSSIEQATISVVLGTCPAWSRPALDVCIIQQATIPVVLGTCPAWSGPAVAVIPVASPV